MCGSFWSRLKRTKSGSNGAADFVKNFVAVIFSSIGYSVMLVVFMAIPASMIAMGSIHLDDCPVERMIPIYLIVSGVFGIVKNLITLIMRCFKSRDELEEEPTKVNPATSIIDCFLFAWFIAGCVYIYRTKDEFQSTDKTLDDYCDYTFYWFAFWINTAVFIAIGATCLCGAVLLCIGSF